MEHHNHHCDHDHKPFTRRDFIQKSAFGLGALGLASLINPLGLGASNPSPLPLGGTHFAPRAKRIIYLYMTGAPSQIDLFDYKPKLEKHHGQNLPPGFLSDRIPATSATQATLPMVKALGTFSLGLGRLTEIPDFKVSMKAS